MKTVAVIGASANRAKFGNKAVRAFRQQGFQVFPVNPTELEIEGWPVYRTITEVPVRPSVVSIYVRPSILLGILPEIARRGCDQLWLNPGSESTSVLAEAKRLGLAPECLCSILKLGLSPAQF